MFKNSLNTDKISFFSALNMIPQITPGTFSIAKKNSKYNGLIETLHNFIMSGNINMHILNYNNVNRQLTMDSNEDAGSLCNYFGETLHDEKYEQVKQMINGLHSEYDVFQKHRFAQDYYKYNVRGQHLFVTHLDYFNHFL